MKKLLLLTLMTLLSVTAVEAAQVKLRLSGNNQEDLIKEGGLDRVGSTWVYKCNGSDLTKYVSNNKMYVRANVNQDGTVNGTTNTNGKMSYEETFVMVGQYEYTLKECDLEY